MTPARRHPPRQSLLSVALLPALVLPIPLTGCVPLGFLAQGVAGNSVQPVYVLQDVPTLILVDDPDVLLGDRALAGAIASQIGFLLTQNKASSNLIDQSKLAQLQADSNPGFDQWPVDRVGKQLGAQQVIHVHIEQVWLNDQAQMLHPQAAVQVKVIDALHSRRLFPDPNPINNSSANTTATQTSYRLTAELKSSSSSLSRDPTLNSDSGPNNILLKRKLAQEIGTQVAQLFYKHQAAKNTGPTID